MVSPGAGSASAKCVLCTPSAGGPRGPFPSRQDPFCGRLPGSSPALRLRWGCSWWDFHSSGLILPLKPQACPCLLWSSLPYAPGGLSPPVLCPGVPCSEQAFLSQGSLRAGAPLPPHQDFPSIFLAPVLIPKLIQDWGAEKEKPGLMSIGLLGVTLKARSPC